MHALISPINLNHMVFVSKFDDEMEEEGAVEIPDEDVVPEDEDEDESDLD